MSKPLRQAEVLLAIGGCLARWLDGNRERSSLAPRSGRHQERAMSQLPVRWDLTKQEARILLLVADGLENKEIAAVVGTAVGTVEFHMTNLLRKSGNDCRSKLIAEYWKQSVR